MYNYETYKRSGHTRQTPSLGGEYAGTRRSKRARTCACEAAQQHPRGRDLPAVQHVELDDESTTVRADVASASPASSYDPRRRRRWVLTVIAARFLLEQALGAGPV